MGNEPAKYHEKGIYGLTNVPVYRQPERNRHISAFARIGVNSGETNRFAYYFGTGMVAKGFIPSRVKDRTGVAVAAAVNSTPFIEQRQLRGIQSDRTEINLEFSHRFFVTDWLQLQGDIQYVHNPNMLTRRPDAFVVGLRTIVNFFNL